MNSVHTTTYRDPVMLPKGVIFSMQDSTDNRLYNGGFIETIHHDSPSRHYLVVVRHRKTAQANGFAAKGGYSLLEYDEEFRFIRERAFTDKRHLMPFMLSLSNGTYVLRYESKQEKMRGEHVFDKLIVHAD